MKIQKAIANSPFHQAIHEEGGLYALVTKLEEGGYNVSVFLGEATYLAETVPDEQAVEQLLWDRMRMRSILFEPVLPRKHMELVRSPSRTWISSVVGWLFLWKRK